MTDVRLLVTRELRKEAVTWCYDNIGTKWWSATHNIPYAPFILNQYISVFHFARECPDVIVVEFKLRFG